MTADPPDRLPRARAAQTGGPRKGRRPPHGMRRAAKDVTATDAGSEGGTAASAPSGLPAAADGTRGAAERLAQQPPEPARSRRTRPGPHPQRALRTPLRMPRQPRQQERQNQQNRTDSNDRDNNHETRPFSRLRSKPLYPHLPKACSPSLRSLRSTTLDDLPPPAAHVERRSAKLSETNRRPRRLMRPGQGSGTPRGSARRCAGHPHRRRPSAACGSGGQPEREPDHGQPDRARRSAPTR